MLLVSPVNFLVLLVILTTVVCDLSHCANVLSKDLPFLSDRIDIMSQSPKCFQKVLRGSRGVVLNISHELVGEMRHEICTYH